MAARYLLLVPCSGPSDGHLAQPLRLAYAMSITRV
jgi:hypothetical protein